MKTEKLDREEFESSLRRLTNMASGEKAIVSLLNKFLSRLAFVEIGKPVDIWRIFESYQINVVYKALNEPGYIEKSDKDNRYTVYINLKSSLSRRKFTAAHELSHFILFIMLRDYYDNLNSRSCTAIEERMCNLMASEMLMPIHYTHSLIKQNRFNDKGVSNILFELGVSLDSFLTRLKAIVKYYYHEEIEIIRWQRKDQELVRKWNTDSDLDLSSLILGFTLRDNEVIYKPRYKEERLISKSKSVFIAQIGTIALDNETALSFIWDKKSSFRFNKDQKDFEWFFDTYFFSIGTYNRVFKKEKYSDPLIRIVKKKLGSNSFQDIERKAEANLPHVCNDLKVKFQTGKARSNAYHEMLQVELSRILRDKYLKTHINQ